MAGEATEGKDGAEAGEAAVRHEPEALQWAAATADGDAVLAYARLDDGTLDLQHTIVPPSARGQGVADALVRAAVAHARAEGVRLIPTCPYVAAWASRHPDAADVFVAAAD